MNIDTLIHKSIFSREKLRFRKILRNEARSKGIIPSSLFHIYKKIARGEIGGFTVPAFNLRTLTYDLARAIFRSAKRCNAGLFIFELARQEKEYTSQSFDEYVISVLSAALKEEFFAPVFIQADHVQISRNNFRNSSLSEISEVKKLIKEAIRAGVYNIDIDASTLVDIKKKSEREKQRNNFKITAQLIKFIREIQPENMMINLGGEIGEIGKRNSTPEDLRAFMEGLNEELEVDCQGISKISIQTGTTHGGVVLPDGKIADVSVDFETIKELSEISRNEYGLAGVVQHGASTLPIAIFNKFPDSGCVEIHLATGIQNIFFDEIPEEFKKNIYDFILQKYETEKKKYSTKDQFIYKTRKFALGEFRKKIWLLPEDVRNNVAEKIERWAFKILNLLKVNDTLKLINTTKSKKF